MAKKAGLRWALGTAVFAVGGAAFLWSQSGIARAASSLSEELAIARGLGLPTSPETLRASIARRTEGTNAAPYYLDAFARGKGLGQSLLKFRLRLMDGSATETDREKARHELLALDSMLASMDRGSRQAHLNYDRRWELGMGLPLPDLAETRRMTNALISRGVLEAESGDLKSAERSLLAAARVSAHLSDDPLYISMMVQAHDEQAVLQGAMRVVQLRKGEPASRQLVRNVLNAIGPVSDFRSVIGTELTAGRVMVAAIDRQGLPEFGKVASLSGSQTPIPDELSVNAFRFGPVRRANEATLVRYWRELYEAAPSDPEDLRGWQAAAKAVNARFMKQNDVSYILTKLLVPELTQILNALGSRIAIRRSMTLAIDLVDSRNGAGRFVQPVAGLADPFGDRIKVKGADDRIWVYSVGPNGRDDGGATPPVEDTSNGMDDIGVWIPGRFR